MNNIICPKCGEVLMENPICESMGIVTCDKCKEQIIWKCDGEKVSQKIS